MTENAADYRHPSWFMKKPTAPKIIYCAECDKKVPAQLTDGAHIYPRRPDLADIPFWQCGKCGNWVGCHYKTCRTYKPLGIIPNKRLREWRVEIHSVLDPLWRSGKFERKQLYELLSARLGREYHTAALRTPGECQDIYLYCVDLAANK